jgi:DMSO/TMAO reductase YedYZ molybdopterin-dependent catalytic subunit
VAELNRLPPGQRAQASFPRFGVPFAFRPLRKPAPSAIRIRGALAHELEVAVARLRDIQRKTLVADFHCVTGWSAEGLRWGGVQFRTFYTEVIAAEAEPRLGISHVLFRGADGYRSVLTIEDALEEDVLLADELDDRPLSDIHGAPVRLVSPKQYGYKSTKHLCAIELHTVEPRDRYAHRSRRVLDIALAAHPRARVWEEERHRYLPAWGVRALYRGMIAPTVRYWNRGN